jgi:molecular chaperone GrpE (heat shock protein)
MNEISEWKVPKWPFLLADALLIFFAYYFVLHTALPVHHWEIAAGCIALGAVLGVIPYYLDYRAMGKVLEVSALTGFAEKIQNLETLSAQIGSATNHWTGIQETVNTEAGKTSAAAREIAEKMAGEIRQFTDFMQKMNDNEKATLRLEVEKLHRAETEWLQILVHILDHVFALHTGAARTNDQRFIEPIANFQNTCRDTVRRLGLTPFAPAPDDLFDSELHQVAGGKENPPAGAVISEAVGSGYTFQGKLLRPALVRVVQAPVAEPEEESLPAKESVPANAPAAKVAENELPL